MVTVAIENLSTKIKKKSSKDCDKPAPSSYSFRNKSIFTDFEIHYKMSITSKITVRVYTDIIQLETINK